MVQTFCKLIMVIATLSATVSAQPNCFPYSNCVGKPRSLCIQAYQDCIGIPIARQGTTLYVTQIQNLSRHNLVMKLEEYPMADLPVGAVTYHKIRIPFLSKTPYDYHTRLTFWDPETNHVVAYLIFNKKLQQSPFGYIGATITLNNHLNQTLYEWTPADKVANEQARHDIYEVKIILKGRLGLRGSTLEVRSFNAGGSSKPVVESNRRILLSQPNIIR